MLLSDTSIKRPVFASVIGLLLIAVGFVSFTRLALREYPDIDPPIVSIRTTYQGASANVVETRITEVIEDRISGIEGIRFINSSSQDGQSIISIEFDISRNMDSAANDVRDRVTRIMARLPLGAAIALGPLVSVAAMQLVEQGRMLLTNPLPRWLPTATETSTAPICSLLKSALSTISCALPAPASSSTLTTVRSNCARARAATSRLAISASSSALRSTPPASKWRQRLW